MEVVLQNNMMDEILDTNKGHIENNVANKIVMRPRVEKRINGCKVVTSKYKEKRRKNLPNRLKEIRSCHVTFEF